MPRLIRPKLSEQLTESKLKDMGDCYFPFVEGDIRASGNTLGF